MSIAVIFAGGSGTRMNTKGIPKQFLRIHGKPIIIHTLEKFEQHELIQDIIVVSPKKYINLTKKILLEFKINKVRSIVAGGETAQESIFNGLNEAFNKSKSNPDQIVLIHDGVRPFIDEDLITRNIEVTKQRGSAISVVPAIETIVHADDSSDEISRFSDRASSYYARAPQTFFLRDIYDLYIKAKEEGFNTSIDSASLAARYNKKLHTVFCNPTNIKITTKVDFYLARTLFLIEEDGQLNEL